MTSLTPKAAQELETTTKLRIKFASMRARGDLVGDAHDEYRSFFVDLPEGWRSTKLGMIETRTEHTRQAHFLTNDQIGFMAVEHETGVELLLISLGVNLASAAIVTFAKWGWARWKKLREESKFSPKQEVSLVIEIPRSGGHGANAVPPLRLVVPTPVSNDDIERYLKIAAQVADSI